MKYFITLLCFALIALSACEKETTTKSPNNTGSSETIGTVTFATNFDVFGYPTVVNVYMDDELLGQITNSTDTTTNCGIDGQVTTEIEAGYHTYRYVIDVDIDHGSQNVEFEKGINVIAGECNKVFFNCSASVMY